MTPPPSPSFSLFASQNQSASQPDYKELHLNAQDLYDELKEACDKWEKRRREEMMRLKDVAESVGQEEEDWDEDAKAMEGVIEESFRRVVESGGKR